MLTAVRFLSKAYIYFSNASLKCIADRSGCVKCETAYCGANQHYNAGQTLPKIKNATSLVRFVLISSILCLVGCSTVLQRNIEPYGFRYDIYTVKPGEGMEYIADYFGIPANILITINGRNQDQELVEGTQLMIPFFEEVYPAKMTLEEWDSSCSTFSLPARYLWPVVGGGISSRFGRRWGRLHEGVDIRAPEGIPIFAAKSGEVIFAGNKQNGYGNLVIVTDGGKQYLYGHQSFITVRLGDYVRQGDLIGFVGSTGRATGPHLHFEVQVRMPNNKYKAVEPLCFYVR